MYFSMLCIDMQLFILKKCVFLVYLHFRIKKFLGWPCACWRKYVRFLYLKEKGGGGESFSCNAWGLEVQIDHYFINALLQNILIQYGQIVKIILIKY